MSDTRGSMPPSVDDENISEAELSTYFGEKYGAFAISANARAIPDSRDGLKPVHRRILYAALGVAPAGKSMVKAAKLVGEVLAG